MISLPLLRSDDASQLFVLRAICLQQSVCSAGLNLMKHAPAADVTLAMQAFISKVFLPAGVQSIPL